MQTALDANPYDSNALYLHARCLLAKGYLYGAPQRVNAPVLTALTTFGPGYAVRSVVEARLGSIDRGKADYELATRFDAKAAAQVNKDYVQAVADSQADASGNPATLYQALVKAAPGNDNADALIPAATSVVRAQNNVRKRWDETYQDRLRVLESDLRDDPKSVVNLMTLGKFLYIESDIPGEQLSPGGKYRPFRFNTQFTRDQEILRADKTFDQILAIDPKNAEALTWKAAIRLDHGNWDDGEALVNQAIQINPELPQLLELLARRAG